MTKINEAPAVHIVYAGLGSVSTGTLILNDLLAAFADQLEWLAKAANRLPEFQALLTEARAIPEGESSKSTLEADDVLTDLQADLEEFAPPYAYFGTLEGDGADFGFWISWSAIEEAKYDGTLIEVADPAELDSLEAGIAEALHVNDHGNATLYQREPSGAWRVVWDVV